MPFKQLKSYKYDKIPKSELNKKRKMTGLDGKVHNYKIYSRRAKKIYKDFIEQGGVEPASILPKYLEYKNGGIYTKKLSLSFSKDKKEYKINDFRKPSTEFFHIQLPVHIATDEDYEGEESIWITMRFDIKVPKQFSFHRGMIEKKEIIERMIKQERRHFYEIGWGMMKITKMNNVNLNQIAMFSKKLSHQILDTINTDNKRYFQKDGECVIYFLYNELKDVRGFSHLTIKWIKDQFKNINVNYEKGITTANLIDWIKRFTNGHISLHCLDPRLKRFEKYIGTKKIILKTLVFCINENHLYPITNDTFKKSIAQKGRLELNDIRWNIQGEFHKRITKEERNDLINGTIDEKYQILIIDEDDMMDILTMVINKHKFLMDINIKQSKVVMFVHPITQQIIMVSNNYDERKIVCDKLFKKFKCEYFKFNNQSLTTIGSNLMNMMIGTIQKSHYNIKTRDIIDKYTPYPIIQRIENNCNDFGVECIDVERSYKNAWLNNQFDYPIYTLNDTFEKFDGNAIRCGEYLVDTFEVFGLKFKKALWNCNFINYLVMKKHLDKNKIKYVLKPSYKIKADTFKKFIEYCYKYIPEKVGDIKMRKNLINFVIGQFNQKFITSEKGFITSSFEIACGMYHKIKYEEGNKCELDEINDYYFIRETYNKRLLSDNTSINRQIICGGLVNLIKLIETCYDEKKSTLIGVRVDSIYIKNPVNTSEKELLKNGHRIETEIHIPKNREYEERDDFDENIINKRRWNKTTSEKMKLRGKSFCVQGVGGSGKSYLLIENNDENTITFGFTNKSINNLRTKKESIDISTLDKYFGHDENRTSSISKLKKIQIDEYSMVPMKFWNILYKIKKQNPEIIFEIYGDYNQCKSVEEFKRYFNFFESDFFKEICDDNLIIKEFRKDCGRYDDELKEELDYLLKHKKLSKKWKNKKIKPNLKYNIVNRNKTRDKLITKYHPVIKKGDRVICEKNLYKEEIYNSEFYIVEDIKKVNDLYDEGIYDIKYNIKNQKFYLVTNQLKEKVWINTKTGNKNTFKSGIATTIYKYQGDTIHNEFNIYDIHTMTLNELYTAISRGTCFDNVNLNYTERIFEDEQTKHNKICKKNGFSTEIKPESLEIGFIYKCITKDYTFISSTKSIYNPKKALYNRLKDHLKSKKSPIYKHRKLDWKIKLLSKVYFEKKKNEMLKNVEYRYIYFDEDRNKLLNENYSKVMKFIENKKPKIENGTYDEDIIENKFNIVKHKDIYRLRFQNKEIKIDKRVSFKKNNSKAMKKISDFKDNLMKKYYDLEHKVNFDKFCKENEIQIENEQQKELVIDFIKIFENGLNPVEYRVGNNSIKQLNKKYILAC